MPWKECHVMNERMRFVARLLEGEKMGAAGTAHLRRIDWIVAFSFRLAIHRPRILPVASETQTMSNPRPAQKTGRSMNT